VDCCEGDKRESEGDEVAELSRQTPFGVLSFVADTAVSGFTEQFPLALLYQLRVLVPLLLFQLL
jgi:hypothetical protein